MERLTLRDDDGRALLTPYGLSIYCSTQATADCICKLEEALQAQEPRLVTEADFENADEDGFIPVWCEVMDNAFDSFIIKDYWNCIPIDALETEKEDGYRYWTAKPSLKQMEETPWS